jgi:peptidoglycan/LPS O-acetylase OafA/YrhL
MRMLVTTPRRPVRVHTEPERDAQRDTRPLHERLADQIPLLWALWGGLALIGANVAATVLEPAPADPSLPQPWFVALPSTMVALGILAAGAGLLLRRRWGMALSLVSAGIALVMVVACPLSGHHHFGLWWVGELACLGAWAAVSLAGLRSPAARA